MERQTLQAEVREQRGKGPARQLRMQGRIPGILYGPGLDPMALSVTPKHLVRVLSTPWGRNVLVEVAAGDKKELCMVRELQAHPVTGFPLHVDFYRVDLERPVRVTVPFATRGRAIGVQKGGKLKKVYREVPVVAVPERIPSVIEVDVSALDQGQTLTVGELSLPEGVSVTLKPDRTVVVIEGERKKRGEEETEDAAKAG